MKDQTIPIKRDHKARLFNFIFGSEENRAWTLQLYNAVNCSHYNNPSLIEFNTLKDVLYIGMSNDTSFLISEILSVYEYQSSYNPNMPLRMLEYVSSLYSGYITDRKLNKYGTALISLPVPKLVVFYNGKLDISDETILKLSDSFPKQLKKDPDIEVRVRMLNINYGRNQSLLSECQPLREYSWFINEINSNLRDCEMPEAVKRAIRLMPEDYVIRNFLLTHKSEVERMLDTEYNEAEIKELFVEDGRREGHDLLLIEQICKKLAKGKSPEIISDEVEEPLERVVTICNIAVKYAPAYNAKEILQEITITAPWK